MTAYHNNSDRRFNCEKNAEEGSIFSFPSYRSTASLQQNRKKYSEYLSFYNELTHI